MASVHVRAGGVLGAQARSRTGGRACVKHCSPAVCARTHPTHHEYIGSGPVAPVKYIDAFPYICRHVVIHAAMHVVVYAALHFVISSRRPGISVGVSLLSGCSARPNLPVPPRPTPHCTAPAPPRPAPPYAALHRTARAAPQVVCAARCGAVPCRVARRDATRCGTVRCGGR